MKYSKVYYWNMYAPHKILRRYLSRVIYSWADKKYGVKARGDVNNELNSYQKKMLEKWHSWMRIKNKIGKI